MLIITSAVPTAIVSTSCQPSEINKSRYCNTETIIGIKKNTSSPNTHFAPRSTMPVLITPLPNKASIKNSPNTPEEIGRWAKRTIKSDTSHTKPTTASCKVV